MVPTPVGGVERPDPGAAGTETFGQSPLRCQFHFEFTGQVLPAELLVTADVGGDNPGDAAMFEE
jgi:hypothetical protein